MTNSMKYESQALVGSVFINRRIFEAADIDAAKAGTWEWLLGLNASLCPTQAVLLLGGQVAWASPVPAA